MADQVTFIVDGAAMADLLRSPSGPVGRDMIVRATRVQTRARMILAPHRKTGCLDGSLVKRAENVNGELGVRIVSDTTSCSPERKSYSLDVHDGTHAHDIAAVKKQALAFPWHGHMAIYRRVHHPGTRPIPFLRDALPAAGP